MAKEIIALDNATWDRILNYWAAQDRRDVDDESEIRYRVEMATGKKVLANNITPDLCETIRKYGKERWDLRLAEDTKPKPRKGRKCNTRKSTPAESKPSTD